MNESNNFVYVGVDVSKECLDVKVRLQTTPLRKYKNNKRGFHQLIRWLSCMSDQLWVVCEATGGYERALVKTLLEVSIRVSVVNPRRVREYIRSQGQLAKTDSIDAAMLADYGAHCKRLMPRVAPTAAEQNLRALVDRRNQIKKMLRAESNRLEKAPDAFIAQMIRRIIKTLKKQLQQIENLMSETVNDDQSLVTRSEKLQKIKGVGWLTACVVLARVHELGKLSDKGVSALAGLAPYARDSGSKSGKRFIGQGRANLRRDLYMPALTASRHNPHLRPFYQRLCQNGKLKKVALTAVMRKLIIHMNRCLISNP